MTQPEDPYGTPAEHPTPPSGPQPPEPGQPPAGSAQPPAAYGQPPAGQYGAPPAGQYGAPPAAQYGAPPAGYGAPAANYASWIQRVGAYLIDAIIAAVPFLVLFLLGSAIGGGFGGFLLVIGYLVGIGIWIWNYVFRQGNTGQTIGKQQLGITLIRESDGQFVGPGMSFVRGLAHIVDGIPCDIGYLWPLWDNKRQTFADKICGTIVVHR
jgi:uncharacterized RDD family membrane protein YckC